MLLEIQNLTKYYGNKLALKNVCLNLQEGKIIGLLGPNGSGKTTLIKVLLGLLRQYGGEVKFLGENINDKAKSHIAYLPDKNHIPLHWNLKEAFGFFGDFFDDFDIARAEELSERLKIDTKSKLKTLSKGNKEKVALLLTLSRRARLYILDEPIAGVDPVARDEVFSLIMQYCKPHSSINATTSNLESSEQLNTKSNAQSSNKSISQPSLESANKANITNNAKESYSPSVLIATHLIYDVEQILDEAIFLSYGSVLAHKSVADFTRQGEQNPINLEQAFKEFFKNN
ncbi:ABC transporter ATP-binding protein [Helicobacter sp. T3_23-1059]